jgi:hypothetical protein
LTPIVAQSSLDASLNSMATLPLCEVGGLGDVDMLLLGLLEPPPHAATRAAAMLTVNSRDVVDNITKNSCS